MNPRRFAMVLLAATAAFVSAAPAEDIDLFMPRDKASDPPYVLFVIDNGANFSATSSEACKIDDKPTFLSGTLGGVEQCALYQTIDALPDNSVRIGVMVYSAGNVQNYYTGSNGVNGGSGSGLPYSGQTCPANKGFSSDNGGCLVFPIVLMTSQNKQILKNWIKVWANDNSAKGGRIIKGNSRAAGATMQEAWAYFSGRQGLSGTTYNSWSKQPCDRYVVFIGNNYKSNGTPQDQTKEKGPKWALEGNAGTLAAIRAFPPATAAQKELLLDPVRTECSLSAVALDTGQHENNGYYADEWARYMKAQGITTFSIGVLGPSCVPEYAALLINMAGVGGGEYYPTRDTQQLYDAFQAAFGQILSKNSAFASVSLPVSVNTEGTYLNQVFIGMFRPDMNPRWFGNLKQYRLGRPAGSTTGLELQDAQTVDAVRGKPAIAKDGTGFINSCAVSYWTPEIDAAADGYWALRTEPTCTVKNADGTSKYPGSSNTPDGNIVEKGGAGYLLRGSPTATSVSRNIETCNGDCSSTDDFDSGNSSIVMKDGSGTTITGTTRTELINWSRGINLDKEQANVVTTAMRPSVHGDVVHSRPFAINYGTLDAPNVVVFYGANDGALRAINGNRTTSFGSVPAGGEFWSFVPPEFYGQFSRLRDDSPKVKFQQSGTISPDPLAKPYGFDGPVSAYLDGDDKWIFATMRRGGRAVYRFDVSEIPTKSPSLKWRIGCSSGLTDPAKVLADDSNCESGFEDIGQTWSTPKIIKTLGYAEGTAPALKAKPMLIMGGGYDVCEDEDSVATKCTSDSKGSAVYVFDAESGKFLNKFDLATSVAGRAVVADVFIVPDGSAAGLAKWAYVADTGGNVWRISGGTANEPFGDTPPDEWTITRIAALGCDPNPSTATVPDSCNYQRKFLFAPDVVVKDGIYYLLLGSGDREKPLMDFTHAYAVENHFFMIKDSPADSTWLSTESSRCGKGVLCKSSLAHVYDTTDATQLTEIQTDLADGSKKGWYLDMRSHEQVVTSAITVFGVSTFSTHVPMDLSDPDTNECASDLGTARVYNVRYFDAKGVRGDRSQVIEGGGLPPSPVAGMVKLDGEAKEVPFLIGGDPDSPLEGGEPSMPSSSKLPKSLTYWFIKK